MTRRNFANVCGAGFLGYSEAAFAQRAAMPGMTPADTVFLNANENPDGPPVTALEAARAVLPTTGRYHYQEFGDFYATVARSEDLEPSQVLVGAGSSEILHCAVDAFTGPDRPAIVMDPTYEAVGAIAEALRHPVVRIPLTEKYGADVKRMAEEAKKAGGGLIYLCNPNNPTSTLTPAEDVNWLATHVPANTILLVDEAYLHFHPHYEQISAAPFVKQGRNVVISRSFSKIYGMAGLRVGFAMARPELIARMDPFRNSVISIVSVRATIAALSGRGLMISQRRLKLIETRTLMCDWLRRKGIRFIDPVANFMMIEVKKDPAAVRQALFERGVAIGRPFPPINNMIRVSIGTTHEMEKFQAVFERVAAAS